VEKSIGLDFVLNWFAKWRIYTNSCVE